MQSLVSKPKSVARVERVGLILISIFCSGSGVGSGVVGTILFPEFLLHAAKVNDAKNTVLNKNLMFIKYDWYVIV